MGGIGLRALVARYLDDDVMLDALWQWANNPTPVSEGLAIEQNFQAIKNTLLVRYELSPKVYDEYIAVLRRVHAGLSGSGVHVYDLFCEVTSILHGEAGVGMRHRVAMRVKQLSLPARTCVAVLHWIKTHSDSTLSLFTGEDSPEVAALLEAVLGRVQPDKARALDSIVRELIHAGVLQRLYRVSASRKHPWAGHVLGHGMIVPPLELESLIPEIGMPDIELLVDRYIAEGRQKSIAAIDELLSGRHNGLPGMRHYWEYSKPAPPELLPIQGVIGICQYARDRRLDMVAALNPLVIDFLRQACG